MADQKQATSLPDSVRVKDIDRKSPDWIKYHYAWDRMHWLYEGGVEIEGVAEQFLKRRAKEVSDIYQARVEQFRYQNQVGTLVDYYVSTLFGEPPRIQPAVDPGVTKTAEEMLNDQDTEFYDDFTEDCDGTKCQFLEHARRYFRDLIVYGRAISLVDLPRPGDFATLADQRAAGNLDPFLVAWDSRQLINHSKDSNGVLQWVIFSARESEQEDPWSGIKLYDRWYYFDQHVWAIYQRLVPDDERGTMPDDAKADLVGTGEHALTDLGVVPVIFTELPKGLWLMNRVYNTAMDHLNADNTLGFALYMAALAMPVVKTDGEFTVTLGEANFIKLPADASYEWSEPEGRSWEHLAQRIESLRQEIYRQFYLVSESRSVSATASAQSGISKQQDMMASKKILNALGDVMRSVIQAMYDFVSEARKDDVEWDVRGLNFPETPPNDTIDTVASAKAIGIKSDTFEREMNKMVVDVVLVDANPQVKAQIYEEIESAPTLDEQAQQELEQSANKLIGNKLAKQGFAGV